MNAGDTSLNNIRNTKCDSFNDELDRIKNTESTSVVRRYVNPAVYIESSIYDMAPNRRRSMFSNYIDTETEHKIIKVKRCVCFTAPNYCPCHPLDTCENSRYRMNDSPLELRLESKAEKLSPEPSQIILKPAKHEDNLKRPTSDELKLSLVSIASTTMPRCNDEELKEEVFRNWCARKNQEKKLQEQKETLLRQIKQKQHELQLEQERDNFRRWLSNKKKEEEKRRRKKQKELEEEKNKEDQKQKRMLQNDLHYQLWLRKKEELVLEKKIQEQIKLLRQSDEKCLRIEESTKAYESWLKDFKNKPKPIPLNQGLLTLRSSASVTYVNPTAWVPNIDIKHKPASQ